MRDVIGMILLVEGDGRLGPSEPRQGGRGVEGIHLLLGDAALVAEPPKLYGPHVSVIVSQTSDYSTRKPHNPGSLSGVLEKPKSSTFSFQAGYITESIAVLQQFIQLHQNK